MSVNQNAIVGAMKKSGGRFFGLTTKTGERINAQYVEATPNTVVVYDRNRYEFRRLNKTSLRGFKMGSVVIA